MKLKIVHLTAEGTTDELKAVFATLDKAIDAACAVPPATLKEPAKNAEQVRQQGKDRK